MKKSRQHSNTLSITVLQQIIVASVAFLVGVVVMFIYYETMTTRIPNDNLLPTQITGGKEIERKWLIDPEKLPFNLTEEANDTWQITQTYFNFSPEMRVRKLIHNSGQTSFIMTVKSDPSDDGLTRDEREWTISEQDYLHLLDKAEGNTISKTRYSVRRDGLRYEYDVFHDQLDGLYYLEIEFTDESTARNFATPDYAVKDVTSDDRYKNQSLAQFGIPQE